MSEIKEAEAGLLKEIDILCSIIEVKRSRISESLNELEKRVGKLQSTEKEMDSLMRREQELRLNNQCVSGVRERLSLFKKEVILLNLGKSKKVEGLAIDKLQKIWDKFEDKRDEIEQVISDTAYMRLKKKFSELITSISFEISKAA